MKRLLGDIRRADEAYGMIRPGEKVAVGLSGGKDSLALLYALSLYRRFEGKDFSLMALTLTMEDTFDTAPLLAFCEGLDVPLRILRTDIFSKLFGNSPVQNPCAMCARLRRGALLRMAKDENCGALALGHTRDDALETLLMSALYGRRFHTFSPVTVMEDTPVRVIRPMIYASEKNTIHCARAMNLPVCKSPCPVSGRTARQEMKETLDALTKRFPAAREALLDALASEGGPWER